MTSGRAPDTTALKVINLAGFTLVLAAAVAGFAYFARSGGHPWQDLLSLAAIAALVGLTAYCARRVRGSPSR